MFVSLLFYVKHTHGVSPNQGNPNVSVATTKYQMHFRTILNDKIPRKLNKQLTSS